MCYKVSIKKESRTIEINGQVTTIEELRSKRSKNKIENNILKMAEMVFKDAKCENPCPHCSQGNIDFNRDDIQELVASDAFKGDFHSQALVS